MWNYRIIKFPDHVGLYETIYNDSGEVAAHSERPEVTGESIDDLGETIKLMLHDYNRHVADPTKVLDGESIEFAKLLDPDDPDQKLIPFTELEL